MSPAPSFGAPPSEAPLRDAPPPGAPTAPGGTLLGLPERTPFRPVPPAPAPLSAGPAAPLLAAGDAQAPPPVAPAPAPHQGDAARAAFEKASTAPLPASLAPRAPGAAPLPASTVPLPASTVPLPASEVPRPPSAAPAGELEPTLPPDSNPRATAAPKHPRRTRWLWGTLGVLVCVSLAGGAAFLWGPLRPTPTTAGEAIASRVLLTGLEATPPHATLEVFVPRGARLTVDGNAVSGAGDAATARWLQHPIALRPPSGERVEVETLELNVAVEVTQAGDRVQRSSVAVRAPVTPLALSGPGPRVAPGSGALVVSGSSHPGALIQADNARARADDQGKFLLPVGKVSPRSLVISAAAPEHLPRSAPVEIVAAPTPSSAPPPTLFSALGAQVGKRVRLDGRLSRARSQPDGIHLTVQVTHGCPRRTCEVTALFPALSADTGAPPRDASPVAVGREVILVGELVAPTTPPHLRAEAVLAR